MLGGLLAEGRALGRDDPATLTRLLARRLEGQRPAHAALVELALWLVASYDGPAGLAADGWAPDPTYPGGWRPPASAPP